jgi:DNA-binding CsgD family transcriptional regulator
MADGGTIRLSRRERGTLSRIRDGHTTEGIARDWGIKPATVWTLRKRLYAKLGVNCAPSAVAEGYRRGLFEDAA